jgi:hypothetical protein
MGWSTRLRWADRILSDGMVGRLRADPEQKQDFGDVIVTQGIDTQWPITEALLWRFFSDGRVFGIPKSGFA